MRLAAGGRRFIERREGCSLVAYDDFDNRPWATSGKRGTKTIGYGTTAADISPLPDRITQAEADRLFAISLGKYENAVAPLFQPGGPLFGLYTDDRFTGLVSFAYNLGVWAVPHREHGRWQYLAAFATMGRAILSGSVEQVARAFPIYCNPGSVWEAGLRARRNAEAALFRRQPARWWGFTPQEQTWITEYDRLRSHPSAAAAARRHQLVGAMIRERKRIWVAAHASGDWISHNRLGRYRALLRRTR